MFLVEVTYEYMNVHQISDMVQDSSAYVTPVIANNVDATT